MSRSALTAMFLGSSMLTGAAQAQLGAEASICEKLKSGICQRRNLSDATEALCARIDTGLPALCGKLDVILGSAAADGRVLDLLSHDFNVLPAEDGLAGPVLRPLIVGPGDLDDPELIAYLGDTYDAGETVAIVGATQDEADRFQTLVGDGNEANCEPSADSSEIGFYGLHKSITKRPALVSSYCLPGSITGKDSSLRQQFQDYFAPEFPMEPDEVAVEDLDGNDVLEDLATSVHCQATFSDLDSPGANLGAQMSVNAVIRSVRSFPNKTDYYDFNVNVMYKGSTKSGPKDNRVNALICDPKFPTDFCTFTGKIGQIVAASPSTSSGTDDYPKDIDFTTSGGFRVGSGNRGYLKLAARAALAIAKAVRVSVAPTAISATHVPSQARLQWDFKPNPKLNRSEVFNPQVRWLWSVDRDSYADDGVPENGGLKSSIAVSFAPYANTGQREQRSFSCRMPYPWPRWDVDKPVITKADPDVVRVGETFHIEGSGFYDGIVESVIMGGKLVPEQLRRVVDDETIRITVPFDQPTQSAAQIQVTTNFDGTPLDSNRDITVEIQEPLAP